MPTPATTSQRVADVLSGYLDDVAARAHGRLGDVVGVAVTMDVAGRGPATIGASTDISRQIDQTQYDIGEGPCLDALNNRETYDVPDLRRDPRWTTYGPRAADLGAASCLSIPIVESSPSGDGTPARTEPDVVAVLKVYVGRIDGLDRDQHAVMAQFADEVSAGLTLARTLAETAREVEDRTDAMKTRQLIDMAIGVVMERTSCAPDKAFDSLRQLSQHDNVKLTEVARQVLGTLPGGADVDVHFDRAR